MLVTNHTDCAPYKRRTTQGSLPSHLKVHTKLRSDNVRTTTQTSVNTGEKVGPGKATFYRYMTVKDLQHVLFIKKDGFPKACRTFYPTKFARLNKSLLTLHVTIC